MSNSMTSSVRPLYGNLQPFPHPRCTDQHTPAAAAQAKYDNSCFALTDGQREDIRRSEAIHKAAFGNWKARRIARGFVT